MKRFLLSMLSLFLFSSLMLAQTGTRLVGYSAESMGRAGTTLGTFDSPELMLTNPAGLSFLSGSQLDLGIALMLPTVKFQNTINAADGDNNIFPLPALAYVHKYNDSKLTWGVGGFTTGGMGADFTMKHALYRNQDGSYNNQKYHSMLAAMQGGVSVAYQLADNLSVGFTAHMVYSQLEFSMPYSLSPSIMQGIAMPGMTFGQMFAAPPSAGGFGYTEVTASAEMKDLTALGFNGKLGVAFKVNDQLTLGLNYSMPTNLTYENGKATMDMTQQLNDAFGKAVMGYMAQNPGATAAQAQAAVMTQFAGMGIDLSKGAVANYDLAVDLSFPQSIGFGASFVATDALKFALDVEWLNWADAFDKMTIKLSNGNNTNINKMLGNTGSFNLDFPMNWKNSVVVKFGGEYKVAKDATVRLGYAYGQNPVPESTIFPVFPAIIENHVTAGASVRVANPLTVHAAVEMGLNNSQNASNPSIIANEYNASTSELSTLLFHVAFTYNF